MISRAPSPSTNAGVVGVFVAVIVVWALKEFAQVDVPEEVAAAIGGLLSTVLGYFRLGGKREDVSDG